MNDEANNVVKKEVLSAIYGKNLKYSKDLNYKEVSIGQKVTYTALDSI